MIPLSTAESRSGCRIATVSDKEGDGIWMVFKEGSARKLEDEKKGIEAWEESLPGVAPRIRSFLDGGPSTAMLIEYLPGQTFEHIEYFWITILEIWRVLKPGGIVCIIAPSAGNQHRFPVDCWRFYPDGFTALCKYVGLQPRQIYTQWQPKGTYPDSSDSWKDSVLIAEKPAMPPLLKFKHNLKMALRRRLSAPAA